MNEWVGGHAKYRLVYKYLVLYLCETVLVGPCYHGMAHPKVADRGTASDKEGSCE